MKNKNKVEGQTYNPGCSSSRISANFSNDCTTESSQSFTISSRKVASIRRDCSSCECGVDCWESKDNLVARPKPFHWPSDGNTISCGSFVTLDKESTSESSVSFSWDTVRLRGGAIRPERSEIRFSSTWRRGPNRMQSLRISGLICDEFGGRGGSSLGMDRVEVMKVITKLMDRTRLR